MSATANKPRDGGAKKLAMCSKIPTGRSSRHEAMSWSVFLRLMLLLVAIISDMLPHQILDLGSAWIIGGGSLQDYREDGIARMSTPTMTTFKNYYYVGNTLDMPSKKKKSKAKGRKTVDKGGVANHAEGDAVDGKNQRDLDFQMQRLQIALRRKKLKKKRENIVSMATIHHHPKSAFVKISCKYLRLHMRLQYVVEMNIISAASWILSWTLCVSELGSHLIWSA